jgi:hypothetical protein
MAATRRPKKPAAAKGAKTQATTASVRAFLSKATTGPRLADAKSLVAMMQRATGAKAVMWGDAIVGCDTYIVRYADGRESAWPLVALSPRKSAFVLYMGWKKYPDLLKKIGKHKTAGGCLHIKSLGDVDEAALETLIAAAATSRKAGAKGT